MKQNLLTVKINRDDYAEFRDYCKSHKVTMSKVVRNFTLKILDNKEPMPKWMKR